MGTKTLNFNGLLGYSLALSTLLHVFLILFIFKVPSWGESEYSPSDSENVDVNIVSPQDSVEILKNMKGRIVDLTDDSKPEDPLVPTDLLSDRARRADKEMQAAVTGPNPNADYTSPGSRRDARAGQSAGVNGDALDNTEDSSTSYEESLARRLFGGDRSNKKSGLFPSSEEFSGLEAVAPNNYLPDIATMGNRTLLNTWGFAYAVFYTRIKRSMENVWNPLAIIQRRVVEKRPLYVTSVNIVLDSSGSVVAAEVERSSGIEELDEEALRTVLTAGPYPNPPKDLLSTDGKIYIPSWYFIVDFRRSFSW